MLSFFPDPYPDELLYSVLARYHVRSGSLSPTATARELLCTRRPLLSLIMPHRINILVGNMPQGSVYTTEGLIFNNTMYPFYTAFLKPERALGVFERMKGSSNINECQIAGVTSQICQQDYLRFCPSCMKEDILMYGESYWHRLHQVPGVFFCSVHNEILLDSKIFVRSVNRNFYPADVEVCRVCNPSIVYTDNTADKLFRLALDIEWVFKNHTKLYGFQESANKYMIALIKKGFTTTTGQIKREKLHVDFLSYYGKEFLDCLNSDIKPSGESWITKILTRNINGHPVRHLLLIRYLYGSINAFIESNHDEYKPFGEGPWPCLNKVSDHNFSPLIENVKIHAYPGNRHITGVFECRLCGFTYARYDYGRDPEKERFRIGYIKSYGHVWEDKLCQCLEKDNMSMDETAKFLRSSWTTIEKHALRLGIKPNYRQPRREQRHIKYTLDTHGNEQKKAEKAMCLRQKWLELQNENKTAKRFHLHKMDPAAFSWLYKYDRDWLEQNSPPPGHKDSNSINIDWNTRDQDLLKTVKKVVKEILNSNEKPEMVTLFGVYKKAGYPTLLKNRINLEKLPKTKEFLLPYFDDKTEFYKRRIRWAVKILFNQGKRVTVQNVYMMAGAGLLLKKSHDLDDIIRNEIEKYMS